MIIINYFPDSTGHISLTLTGLGREPDHNGRHNVYLSYFPGNEHSKTGCRFHRVSDDLAHNAAICIVLPSIESDHEGMSEAAIFDWLKNEFKPTHEPFTWLGNNCAAVIYRALVVGQERSPALSRQVATITSWFFSTRTPGNVIPYCDALGKTLLTSSPVAMRYAAVKRLCTDEIKLSPFLRLEALHVMIKKFDCGLYSLSLIAPFCETLRFILKNMLQELANVFLVSNKKKFYRDLLLLTFNDTTQNTDTDIYFTKIQSIVNFLIESNFQHFEMNGNEMRQIECAEAIFETAINQGLATILMPFLTANELHFLDARERIRPVLNFISQHVNDDLHPHREYQQSSDNLREIMPGIGLGMTRQL